MQKSKNIYSKVNFKSMKYYKVSNNFLSENNQRNVNDVLSVTDNEANLRENEASIAWGRERGRGRMLRGRGRKFWPRGLNIPGMNINDLQGLTLKKNSLCLSIQTSAVRIVLWLRILTTPPGHEYGEILRNTWPTREHVEINTLPPHIQTCHQTTPQL